MENGGPANTDLRFIQTKHAVQSLQSTLDNYIYLRLSQVSMPINLYSSGQHTELTDMICVPFCHDFRSCRLLQSLD
ncbi:hypothetical protein ACB092_01G142800 [Castanea dentata]